MKRLSADALNRFVDWFIPPALSSDREARKQLRLFLYSHIFGPFIGNSVPLSLYLFDPQPGIHIAVLALSITAFWLFPFILRAFGRYNLLVVLSVQNLIFCIVWSCYFYGGIMSPTLPWMLTIPLLAFFYVGGARNLRLVLLAQFAINAVACALLYNISDPPPLHMPVAAVQGLGLISTLAASIYVAMMALFYARALASQVELEIEVRKHLETAAELRHAADEAERAGLAKAEFLAKMTHELRTPLNAVIGYSEILLEEAVEEGDVESRNDLGKINLAGHHLLKLINEILDLSKIEAGKMEMFIETVDLAEMADIVAAEHAQRAAEKRIDLRKEFGEGLSAVRADATRLRQALSQLVDNAIKFTDKGAVTISMRRLGRSGKDWIELRVTDTGIGIAPDETVRLFEKFSVLHDASSSKYGGTGLGLALSKRICRLMGGDIRVESQIGVGSAFIIEIPANPDGGEEAGPTDLALAA